VNRVVVAMLPVLLACGGCSVILEPGESQCETAKDCAARGFDNAVCKEGVCTTQCTVDKDCEDLGLTGQICKSNVCEEPPPDPVWGCLGHVVEPTADPSKLVEFDVPLRNSTDSSPVTNVTVDTCDKLDFTCTGTNPAFPKGLHPDADGIMHMSLFQGFDGFVRITSPDYMEGRLFPGRPIVKPLALTEVKLVKPADYEFLASFAKKQVDPTRGTAILYGVNCQAKPNGGIRFSVPTADTNSAEFYLVNLVPTAYPTAKATDSGGFGGFFNLPVGQTVVTSTRAVDQTYIGESGFQVLANTISYVMIAPTPK
jgi:hypothetical protein